MQEIKDRILLIRAESRRRINKRLARIAYRGGIVADGFDLTPCDSLFSLSNPSGAPGRVSCAWARQEQANKHNKLMMFFFINSGSFLKRLIQIFPTIQGPDSVTIREREQAFSGVRAATHIASKKAPVDGSSRDAMTGALLCGFSDY